MTKRFEITIKSTATEEVRVAKEFTQVTDAPDEGESTFGYTPGTVDQKEVTRAVYTQIVDNLDLPAVIAAVNKMDTSPQMIIDEYGRISSLDSAPDGESHISLDAAEYYRMRKAVEFGEYLAKTAEQFMATLTEKDADAVGDMWGSMRMAIHDFRK